MPYPVTPRTLLLFAALACTAPKMPEFTMPRNIDDVRGRLLPVIEGHPVGEARDYMTAHGFTCEPPMASAADAHANVCRAVKPPHWTVTLLERSGRIADVTVGK